MITDHRHNTRETKMSGIMSGVNSTEEEQEDVPNMSIQCIVEGDNERGIPHAKFIDDVDIFSATFDPPASAELLIGAYSDLIAQYRNFETQLSQKGNVIYIFIIQDGH
jgi:hypothetical protein